MRLERARCRAPLISDLNKQVSGRRREPAELTRGNGRINGIKSANAGIVVVLVEVDVLVELDVVVLVEVEVVVLVEGVDVVDGREYSWWWAAARPSASC